MHSLRREIFLTRFNIGRVLSVHICNAGSFFKAFEVVRVEPFSSIVLALSLTDDLRFELPSFL